MKFIKIQQDSTELESIEMERLRKKFKELKEQRKKEEETLIPDTEWGKGIDTELEKEEETAQKIVYENTKNIPYWVTVYRVIPSKDEEGEEIDKMVVLSSTLAHGMEEAERIEDELEEKHLDEEDILIYIEEYDKKGSLTST